MRKNLLPNNGLPMFAHPETDLFAHENPMMDSWYVNAGLEIDGEILGIQWHQQSQQTPMGEFCMAEFAISNGKTHEYFPYGSMVPVSEVAGADKDKLNVFSPLGVLSGDSNEMELHIASEDVKLDITLKNNGQILYNGTMGMIMFLGTDSYQFSYPNLDMNGTLVIGDKEYKIENQKAWFDRQWSFTPIPGESVIPIPGNKVLSWMWIGMNLTEDGTESVSLWDAYGKNGKNAFATICYEDGKNVNYLMDVEYDDIWKSEKSGKYYPRTLRVNIPEAELSFTTESLIEDPESVHEMISGCQDLVRIRGTYRRKQIERVIGLEIVGDLCGEDE